MLPVCVSIRPLSVYTSFPFDNLLSIYLQILFKFCICISMRIFCLGKFLLFHTVMTLVLQKWILAIGFILEYAGEMYGPEDEKIFLQSYLTRAVYYI